MTLRRTAFTLAVAVLASLGFIALAQAPLPDGAEFNATAFAEFPPDAVIDVRPGRDQPIEREIAEDVAVYLAQLGWAVSDSDATVVITVETSSPLPGIESRDAYTQEDRLRTMDPNRNDRALLVPLNKSRRDPGATQFTVRMTAYRPGQSNLWVGRITGPDTGSGRQSTSLDLARALADRLGQGQPPPQ